MEFELATSNYKNPNILSRIIILFVSDTNIFFLKKKTK